MHKDIRIKWVNLKALIMLNMELNIFACVWQSQCRCNYQTWSIELNITIVDDKNKEWDERDSVPLNRNSRIMPYSLCLEAYIRKYCRFCLTKSLEGTMSQVNQFQQISLHLTNSTGRLNKDNTFLTKFEGECRLHVCLRLSYWSPNMNSGKWRSGKIVLHDF